MLFYVRSWRFLCFTYLRIELNSQFRINTHCLKEKNLKVWKKTKLEKEITHKLCHWDVSINCIWIYLEWTTLHTQWWKQIKGYTWLNYFLIKWVAWQTKESALLTLPLPNLLSGALVYVIFYKIFSLITLYLVDRPTQFIWILLSTFLYLFSIDHMQGYQLIRIFELNDIWIAE